MNVIEITDINAKELYDFAKATELLLNEPEDFQHSIQKNLRDGLSYPKAFALAVKEIVDDGCGCAHEANCCAA